jgi:hypothetical protein
MNPLPGEGTLGDCDLQVFTDQAVTDPAVLAALGKRLRRPHTLPPWARRTAFAGALLACFLLGCLVTYLAR